MKEYIVTEHPCFPYAEPKPKELIRCKDCYAYEHQKGDSFGVCKVWMNNTREDGYCHEGEKDENV